MANVGPMPWYRPTFVLFAAFTGFLTLSPPAQAQSSPSERRSLVVATKEAPPFSFKNGDEWTGISIALMHRIAKIEGFSVEFKELPLEEMIRATAEGGTDAAAAALTVTAVREQTVDFTHPFHSSGLGIAALRDNENAWWEVTRRMGSLAFIEAVGALLCLLAVVGILVWLVEHRHNQQFPKNVIRGIGSGFWWSAVTMTTVGYGDKAPVTFLGRSLGLIWMFTSVVIISSFTASIATSLTVGKLRRAIHGIDDLRGKRVLTPRNSTSATFLNTERVRYQTTDTITDALEQLESGRVDAVVYDVPILQHFLRGEYGNSIRLLPYRFARQDYGLALPDGSPERERWNRIILSLIESPEWQTVLEGYLGPNRR